MEKRGSLKVKNKKIVIVALFLLVVLVGCSQKNAEEMTIGEGSFHPDKNDEIVIEGSVSPKKIKYQVVDSNDKVILEGVTKNGLSDIKFKAPKKEDSFYTLKSGELEEEFYVYSVESENEIKEEVVKTENPTQFWQNEKELLTAEDFSLLSSNQKEQYLKLYFNEKEISFMEKYLGSMDSIIEQMDLLVAKNTDKTLKEITFSTFNNSGVKENEEVSATWIGASSETKNNLEIYILSQIPNGYGKSLEKVGGKIGSLVAAKKFNTYFELENDVINGIFKYGDDYLDSDLTEEDYTQQLKSAFDTINKLKEKHGE